MIRMSNRVGKINFEFKITTFLTEYKCDKIQNISK